MADPGDFLLNALRVHARRLAPERFEAEARALGGNWRDVAARAEAERLGPLMHRLLGRRDIAPPAIAARFRRAYAASALRNRHLLRELAAVLRAFAAARLGLIVLKGAALAEVLYQEPALRPMLDLDLLVRPGEREAAFRLLEELGYEIGQQDVHPGARVEHESEILFCKRGALPIYVDLHWSLFDSPHHQGRIDADWLWGTATPTRIAGEAATVLGPEAQVLHLIGHLALHHGGRGLLWHNDIALLLARDAGRIDWEELISRASAYDLRLPVRGILAELVERWEVPVPPAALAAIRILAPSDREAWLFSRLVDHRGSAGERFATDLVALDGWSRRLRFALSHLFPSPAYMRQRYAVTSPWLLPLYYPLRWWRGLYGLVYGADPPAGRS